MDESPKVSKRNPVEKMIVWGTIGILFLIVGQQAAAYLSYQGTLEKVQARFFESTGPNPLRAAEVDQLLGFGALKKEEELPYGKKLWVLTWPATFKVYRLDVYLGGIGKIAKGDGTSRTETEEEREVIDVIIDGLDPAKLDEADKPATPTTDTPEGGGPGMGPGGPGMGPGGPGMGPGGPGRGPGGPGQGPGGPNAKGKRPDLEKPTDEKPADEKPADEKPADSN